MAFLLIAPSITVGYERVFGLVVEWVHPHLACYHTLEEVAHKLALLVDEGTYWAYAFVWLNEALSHVPLLSEGHVSAMMDGTPSADAWGQLNQLQICKLLQHKDIVVCLEGKLEALQFTFQELPLWDAATPSRPTLKPQLIEVDLSSVQPESKTTALQAPTATPVLSPSQLIPLSPLVTLPWPLTCSSRGPWNSCSGLPLQPQPLSPSTACQGESHHWWPWGLWPQLEKQKIPSGQRAWTQPSLPQWQPSHRHLYGWPHQVASSASLTLLTHCSSQPC